MINKATGKTLAFDTAVTATVTDGKVEGDVVITIPATGSEGETGYVPAKTIKVYTSVDLPKNVIVFVPMG